MQSNSDQIAAPTTFYRLPKVREICGGVSSSTVWSWVKNHEKTGFPKPVKLSANCTVFVAAEIEAYAQARISASREE